MADFRSAEGVWKFFKRLHILSSNIPGKVPVDLQLKFGRCLYIGDTYYSSVNLRAETPLRINVDVSFSV